MASLGLTASGFAPSLAIFLVLISLTAVGVSTFHPVMYAIIDEDYPEEKGKILGLYESFGTGAVLLMFLINGFLIQWIGIRGVLILTALPGLIMGLIYHFSSAVPSTVRRQSAGDAGPVKTDKAEILRFVLFLLSVILRVMSVTAILNFLPTLFVNYFGFGETAAAYGTAFFFGGGILGSLTAGKISHRFNPFGILTVGSALIILSILLLSLDMPKGIYPVVICLFGFLGSGCLINQNLLMTRLGGHLGKGEVFGILMGVMTVTSSISPALFGMVVDGGGFHRALMILTVPLSISIIILIFLLRADTKQEAALPPPVCPPRRPGGFTFGKGS